MADKGWGDVIMAGVDALNPTFGKTRKALMSTYNQSHPKSVSPSSTQLPSEQEGPALPIRGMRKGGKVKRDGIFMLHKGEEVLPVKDVKRFEKRKAGRKSGRR